VTTQPCQPDAVRPCALRNRSGGVSGGFIRQTQAGCLGVDGKGQAPHWRLTELDCNGDEPSREFAVWGGERFENKKNPVPQKRDTPSLKSGTPPCPWGAS
jgi:hypothetical protein